MLLYVKYSRQEAPHPDREERQRGDFFDILEALKLLRSRVDRGKYQRRKRVKRNGE